MIRRIHIRYTSLNQVAKKLSEYELLNNVSYGIPDVGVNMSITFKDDFFSLTQCTTKWISILHPKFFSPKWMIDLSNTFATRVVMLDDDKRGTLWIQSWKKGRKELQISVTIPQSTAPEDDTREIVWENFKSAVVNTMVVWIPGIEVVPWLISHDDMHASRWITLSRKPSWI